MHIVAPINDFESKHSLSSALCGKAFPLSKRSLTLVGANKDFNGSILLGTLKRAPTWMPTVARCARARSSTKSAPPPTSVPEASASRCSPTPRSRTCSISTSPRVRPQWPATARRSSTSSSLTSRTASSAPTSPTSTRQLTSLWQRACRRSPSTSPYGSGRPNNIKPIYTFNRVAGRLVGLGLGLGYYSTYCIHPDPRVWVG
ncbi:hypothetical protein T492DRAFT_1131370 [Pavlovales sp. CCMP2436]|nr:hypothetical protein T492DRAFT_1131370 [Pavlovales sp. CCMP2436]